MFYPKHKFVPSTRGELHPTYKKQFCTDEYQDFSIIATSSGIVFLSTQAQTFDKQTIMGTS
jgi:hypothetical protein